MVLPEGIIVQKFNRVHGRKYSRKYITYYPLNSVSISRWIPMPIQNPKVVMGKKIEICLLIYDLLRRPSFYSFIKLLPVYSQWKS